MSNLANSSGDDYPDAAGKHLDDAAALVDAARYDGAAYLSGYVVECSLKTLIVLQTIAKVTGAHPTTLASTMQAGGATVTKGINDGFQTAMHLRHRLDKLSAEVTRLAAQASAVTAAYELPPGPSTMYAPASSPSWRETLRYREPHIPEATARAWLDEAGRVYASTVARMRRDGVVY